MLKDFRKGSSSQMGVARHIGSENIQCRLPTSFKTKHNSDARLATCPRLLLLALRLLYLARARYTLVSTGVPVRTSLRRVLQGQCLLLVPELRVIWP
jgi:hypothetical protein